MPKSAVTKQAFERERWATPTRRNERESITRRWPDERAHIATMSLGLQPCTHAGHAAHVAAHPLAVVAVLERVLAQHRGGVGIGRAREPALLTQLRPPVLGAVLVHGPHDARFEAVGAGGRLGNRTRR